MKPLASLALMLAIVVLFCLWGVAMSHFLLEEPSSTDTAEGQNSKNTEEDLPSSHTVSSSTPSYLLGSHQQQDADGTTLVVVDAQTLNRTIEALRLEITILKSQQQHGNVMGGDNPHTETTPASSGASGKFAAKAMELGKKLRIVKEKLEDKTSRLAELKEELSQCQGQNKKENKEIHHHHSDVDTDEEPATLKPKPRQRHRSTPAPDTENEEGADSHGPATPGADTSEIDLLKAGKHKKGTIPVIVFAYKRERLLAKSMERILLYLTPQFHIYISQDGTEFPLLTKMAAKYANEYPSQVSHLIHTRDTSGAKPEEVMNHWEAYFAICHHYYFALNQVFKIPQYERVIVLEEDIKVAPDFFGLMQASAPLFDDDNDLYCVSGWNDNGKRTLVKDETQLYRSDFFPGLGWMTSRTIWEELKPIWPKGFWDDWMRQPDKRKGRSCLRPEVSRTFTWCTEGEGTSGGQFCDHMQEMKLANTAYPWSYAKNLTGYRKGEYDTWLHKVVDRATEVPSSAQIVASTPGDGDLKIYYNNPSEFQRLARAFDLMDDFKDKVPRTAYQGIITFRYRKHRIHLVAKRELYT